MYRALGVAAIFFVCLQQAIASSASAAVGFWEAIDDKTGQVSSLIQIWQDPHNQNYYGKIYKIFPEGGHKASDTCVACSGVQHDHPMLGVQIIRDMQYENGLYRNGYVLDPRDGALYHAEMRVVDEGSLLKLRGYIGIPLFGKTAEWRRAPNSIV